ncbi:hemolytic protein HlpA [soil metagenome]
MTQPLRTPVAFVIFNRPDTTRRVFDAIARARPSRLLVVADGPRETRPDDAAKVAATRAIIDQVDWDCEVLTNYSTDNLGCRRRVASGIDWVFEQVEEAIVLEDDCLPHPSFFRFCEELLDRFRDDDRVSAVGGANYHPGVRLNDDSYYFSKYPYIWGWASWRDRWKGTFDVDMAAWPRVRDRAADVLGDAREGAHWARVFDEVHAGRIDTWDVQWAFACMLAGRSAAIPNVNLITNIGFGADATHTVQSTSAANLETEAMPFPLRHPDGVFQSLTLDRRYFEHYVDIPLHRRVRNRLDRIARRLKAP